MYPQRPETRFTRPQRAFKRRRHRTDAKECPLATPSACRARIAFDRAGPRVVLRSRHSALWAVAVASNDSQANRPPLLAVLCRCAAGAKALFQKASPIAKPKGGADAGGSGGRSPQRGSIRRGSVATEDRGSGTLPAGDVLWAARRSRGKRPLLVDVAEVISKCTPVTVTVFGEAP